MVKVGQYCKWGYIDSVDEIADGVAFIGTPGHGGMKLDRQRNAQMPKEFRLSGGWYEEDCEAALVILGLPHLFTSEEVLEAHKSVKNWFPDKYESHFNCVIPLCESGVKYERWFKETHKNDYVVISAWGSWHEGVPSGLVGCCATLGGNRETVENEYGVRVWVGERYFLVPEKEYHARGSCGFVIDLDKHIEHNFLGKTVV